MGNGQSLDLSNFYRDEINNLDLGLRGGTTDYIDFIQYNEVIYPLMKGIDMFGRHFVVIKFKLKFNFSNVNISEIRYKKPILDSKNSIILMQTFFQRYTPQCAQSLGGLWMGCGHATENLLDTPGGLNDNQLKFLEKIIDGEVLQMNDDELRPIIPYEYANPKHPLKNETDIDFGYTVELYDENKEKASLVISKFIYNCLTNPNYNICRKIKLKRYDKIIS